MNQDQNLLNKQCLSFNEQEIEKFHQLARQPNLYELIWKSVGSSIFGNDDIKKAIACQLFGGSRKLLPDKTKLRGDINILLLGDPSTGKSQFLKIASQLAPISIYTSGKGSSAAGLTASVIKDQGGQFQLEGGAMVLADNGLVCIDEFDKMNPQDRVAIHEAMEQQTISIAKAGITTILNSRCSVLAAANPIFGSYQESMSSEDQIDFQSTILSRFDCIFMVRDIRDEERDKELAKHIMDLFISAENQQQQNNKERENIIDPDLFRKYIAFCRAQKKPRLSQEAANLLQSYYIKDRAEKKTKIPITVRQLEAIIRLSEAIAKMHLLDQVVQQHVEEAHRIFSVSTLNFAKFSEKNKGQQLIFSAEMTQQIQNVEELILKRIPVGGKLPRDRLVEEMLNRCGNMMVVENAIVNLQRREKIEMKEGMKVVKRVG